MITGHEAAQEIQMRFAPIGDQVEVVAVADAAADHQEHDLAQGMGDMSRGSRGSGIVPKCSRRQARRDLDGGSTAISVMSGLRIRSPHGITSTATRKTR